MRPTLGGVVKHGGAVEIGMDSQLGKYVDKSLQRQ